MPNLKLYVDQDLCRDRRAELARALGPIRECIMHHLGVTRTACQLVIVPVTGLADQPPINVELQILPQPERTRGRIEALGQEIRTILDDTTGLGSGFRCMQHDPATYVTLK